MINESPHLSPLALIAGPTASGKSGLALALAQQANGTVINADSAQVYRDLRILSARPSPAEEARAPHRLYGSRDGELPCSAADWARDAAVAISEAHQAGSLPILVGGTGLYLRALLDGIAPVPDIDPAIRAAVRALPVDQAFDALRMEDPEAAARLRPSDSSRIARALEVVRSTGRSIVRWQQDRHGGIGGSIALRALILLPPRDWLYERCDRRFADMMAGGGIAEVAALMARNLSPSLPVMRAIGVPEIASYLTGRATHEETVAAGQLATRRYAKRQYTWFRHQPPAQWLRFEAVLDCERTSDALALLRLGRE